MRVRSLHRTIQAGQLAPPRRRDGDDAMVECDCKTWAVDDVRTLLTGNGHHPTCEHHIPLVGAIDLLAKLVEGIEYWASQEDGVPDELWDAYKQAVYLTRGQMLSENPRDGYPQMTDMDQEILSADDLPSCWGGGGDDQGGQKLRPNET